MLVSHGREILVQAEPGADTASLRCFLLWQALRIVMQQRGMLVIRGSAVALHGRALLLAGLPGSGTSTLAAALLRRASGRCATMSARVSCRREDPHASAQASNACCCGPTPWKPSARAARHRPDCARLPSAGSSFRRAVHPIAALSSPTSAWCIAAPRPRVPVTRSSVWTPSTRSYRAAIGQATWTTQGSTLRHFETPRNSPIGVGSIASTVPPDSPRSSMSWKRSSTA